jgi:PAS domain S-box-containing protein
MKIGARARSAPAILSSTVDMAVTAGGDLSGDRERDAAVVASMTRSRTAGDLVFELTPAGVFVQVLGPTESLYVPAAEFLGKSVGDVMPPAVAQSAMAAIEQVLRDGHQVVFEYSLPMADRARTYEARMASAGNGHLLAVIRDVDDRRMVERELQESEIRFRLMADHAPVMLWMAGEDGACTFFNQGWLEFSGRTLEQERGVGWAEGIHFEDFQRCMHTYLSSFVERRSFRMEYRLRRADGEYRWVLDTGVPRYARDGSFAGYIGSCIDISELREAQQQLKRTSDDLEVRVNERTEELARRLMEREVLIREVHHRVKNNLQLVSSLLNMQGRQHNEERLRQALEECQGRIQTIALIHQRLFQSNDLAHVALSEYMTSLAANVFQASGVTPGVVALELDVEEVSLSVERAIPCGLILNELITNALKHAFPDGRQGSVRVGLRRPRAGRILLMVADNGVGLPGSFNVEDTRSLGLQLVCTLAEQLDGDLRIERGQGTAFCLEFDADG